jgi:hypothetical protein
MLYEHKVSWDKLVKIIKILIFNFFDIVYECVKSLIREWCDIIVIHAKYKDEWIFV